MRFLHTSDWHIGKRLNDYSRLGEQEQFFGDLIDISEAENVDIVIVAGDIYDTKNPSAASEQLFYKTLKKLSKGGLRPVLVISGNHDSDVRLGACSPLATEQGILVVGSLETVVPKGNYDNFAIVNSGYGFFELEKDGEKVVFVNMPYPSEKRLNMLISEETDEKKFQKSYSHKIGEIFETLSKNFREDTVNVATGHFYVNGYETSQSERDISLGGIYGINADMLPKAQYIALGHLHRPQKVSCACKHAYYSGSPLQYSKSETNFQKKLYIADITAGNEPQVQTVDIKNYKPIEVWKVKSIEEAIKKAEKHANETSYVFLEIETDRVLLQSEIKQLRGLKADIVEIFPIFIGQLAEENETYNNTEKPLVDEFVAFYTEKRGVLPTDEIVKLFGEFFTEEFFEEVENEADFA